MASVATPSQMQLVFGFGEEEDEGLSTPERHAYSAAMWIKDHRKEFKAFMHYLHVQVDQGNPCVTRSDAYAWAREQNLEISDVAGVVRNHNLYPILARYACMLRPRLTKVLHFRGSQVDALDLVSIWQECVNASTFFLAKDYLEAKRLVELGIDV